MRCIPFSYGIYLFVTFGAFLFLPLQDTFAYPSGSNGWHLNSALQAEHNADLVCKVQIISVSREGQYRDGGMDGPVSVMTRMTAHSKVLSVIKGKCPDVLDIGFSYPTDISNESGIIPFHDYTNLSRGEVCIVFLKKSESGFVLNRIRSKARIQPEIVDYNLGNTPIFRLIDEFLVSCSSDDELVKLQAVDELGYLGAKIIHDFRTFKGDKELFQTMVSALVKVKMALSKTNSCSNLVVRNVSIISSFKVDDSPGIKLPLDLLSLDPAEFDQKSSIKKYDGRPFDPMELSIKIKEVLQ